MAASAAKGAAAGATGSGHTAAGGAAPTGSRTPSRGSSNGAAVAAAGGMLGLPFRRASDEADMVGAAAAGPKSKSSLPPIFGHRMHRRVSVEVWLGARGVGCRVSVEICMGARGVGCRVVGWLVI